MTRRKREKHTRILVPAPDSNLDQAADTLADLIAEAVEASLNRSGGTETHGPAYGEAELIEWLSRDRKTA